MVEPNIIIKANYNRTLVTVRVTAINSPDWVDIVGAKIELAYSDDFSDVFYTNSTTHYKVRAYLEEFEPNQTIYGRVTLTHEDGTKLVKPFKFITPYPVLGTVKEGEDTKYITSMRKMGKDGTLSPRNYTNKAVVAKTAAAYIDITADETGDMVVGNRWATNILVKNVTQESEIVEVARQKTTTIAVNAGDVVRVTESAVNSTFRIWIDFFYAPLCAGVSAHITYMPSMDRFTYDTAGTTVPNYFFNSFNYKGTLTSLPEGSFDTHKISKSVSTNGSWHWIFPYFNCEGALTSLPEGSFDTSNFSGSGDNFFYGFDKDGALTSLPEGSFDFDNLQSLSLSNSSSAFVCFCQNGALTSLPEGSFGFSSVTSTSVSTYSSVFRCFNSDGALLSLPEGSFHFHKGLTISGGFQYFNYKGKLTSLPEHSFNFIIGNSIITGFIYFNSYGALTSLPEGSFRFNPNTQAFFGGGYAGAFCNFNSYGALTSLPEGSFDTSAITNFSMGVDHLYNSSTFQAFNYYGALTSLPEGSFNFDNLTGTLPVMFCASFNAAGALKTLPKGSFNFKNITGMYYQCFNDFNYNGALERLPVNAFSTNAIATYIGASFSSATSYHPFYQFNMGGKLTKSETDYNPDFIFPAPTTATVRPLPASRPAYYYDPTTLEETVENVAQGSPFMYHEADYYNVTYTTSDEYTLTIENEYLSGSTVTIACVPTAGSEYMAVPTITTDDEATVNITDNGDNTYTFTMPKSDITVTVAVSLKPAVIELVADATGTLMMTNKWSTPITIEDVTEGHEYTAIIAGGSYTGINVVEGDTIIVTEGTAGSTFRTWYSSNTNGFAYGCNCHITKMPAMNRFTTDEAGTTAGNNFFYYFCYDATGNYSGITSFSAGSLDTSSITTTGTNFFAYFGYKAGFSALPEGSFNISNITKVGANFFSHAFHDSHVLMLPEGSFDTSNITNVSSYFFGAFMHQNNYLRYLPEGSFKISKRFVAKPAYMYAFFKDFAYSATNITSLPEGSFNFDNLTAVGDCFCQNFNRSGKLTSLPEGSFNISNVAGTVGAYFFDYFNNAGALTSLPEGSFNTSKITATGIDFFNRFNASGALTSLPDDSFDISNITIAMQGFFGQFNLSGQLTSLPEGSFNTGNITETGNQFFYEFNRQGKLTSLPAGSFNTSKITGVGLGFFSNFNTYGALTSLPAGSFDTSNIVGQGNTGGPYFNNFFDSFNSYGALTSLPTGSFRLDKLIALPVYSFRGFNNGGKLTSLPAGSFNCKGKQFTQFGNTDTMYPFNNFNRNGKLPRSTTSYNPDFVSLVPDGEGYAPITAFYDGESSTGTQLSYNAPFQYLTA